jgi:hypothetical protein
LTGRRGDGGGRNRRRGEGRVAFPRSTYEGLERNALQLNVYINSRVSEETAAAVMPLNHNVFWGTRTDIWQEDYAISSTCSLLERNKHPKDLRNNTSANEHMNADAAVKMSVN